MADDNERKQLKYSELAAEWQEAGWKARVYPCGGRLPGLCGQDNCATAGVVCANLRKATKALGEGAEKGSYWVGLRRRDSGWGTAPQ